MSDYQQIYKGIAESMLPYGKSQDEIRAAVDKEWNRRLELWRHLRAGTSDTEVGNPSTPIGTPKEFDDGKGGKVTGYWNGSTYAPKAQ